jgi:hypothetical protein
MIGRPIRNSVRFFLPGRDGLNLLYGNDEALLPPAEAEGSHEPCGSIGPVGGGDIL